MSRDDRMGFIIWLIPAVGLAAISIRQGGPISTEHLPAVGGALLLIALAVVVWLVSRRVTRAHAHSGDRARLARHEAGHAEAARRLGRLRSATITGDSGYVDATLSDDAPLPAVTFWLAGQIAAPGCRHTDDDDLIRRELRGLPRRERDAVLRQARRDAEHIVSAGRRRIDRDTARLVDRGRL